MSLNDAVIDRIASRLLSAPPALAGDRDLVPDWMPSQPFARPPVLAAVLIAIVARPEGDTVLYTERSPDLRSHSGQVAFPGGKIDPTDTDAADAALREAHEEVGMARADVRVLGFMPTYFTGTNYLITPVVAAVTPSAPFVPNPGEVHSLFEVPLARILNAQSYGRFHFEHGGRQGQTWEIDHDGHRIWGITANLTRLFRDLAAEEDAA